MSTSLPPYELQLLVANVLDLDQVAADDRGSKRGISCCQCLDTEIFIGCHDGSLMRFVLPELEGVLAEAYILFGRSSTPDGKRADAIHLLPQFSKILVQSDNRIYFYAYPNLDLLPNERPLKNVLSFCVDELPPPPSTRSNQIPPAEICVLKEASVMLYTIREKVIYRKDIPLSEDVKSPRLARRLGKFLCLADTQTYSMIDLGQDVLNQFLPISQVEDDKDSSPTISIVGDNEFLVTTWNGTSTLGVFVSGSGDPAGRLLEYPDRVSSVCVGASSVVALLSNGTILVNQLHDQSLLQEIPSTARLGTPMAVYSNKVASKVPSTLRRDRLRLVDFQLPSEPPPIPAKDKGSASPSKKPRPVSQRAENGNGAKKIVFSKSRVMMQANNALYSLTLRSRITQAEEYIDAHKIKECMAYLERRERPVSGAGPPDPDEAEELRYLQQRLGYRCFTSTMFEDAGTWLFRGELDPRLLISHFPDLSGSVSLSQLRVQVFAGLREHIPTISVEDVISENLVLNYSPHLKPDTKSAPTTAELKKILVAEARKMLRVYLWKWRTKRKFEKVGHGHGQGSSDMDKAVDTVVLRLLAEEQLHEDLRALVDESRVITLGDVEDDLIRYGQYGALIKLYKRAGDSRKLVESYARIVDKEWKEPEITDSDSLDQIYKILEKTRDRELVHEWRIWFIKRDPTRGLKLILSLDNASKRSSQSQPEDHALLEELRRVNSNAADQYLEHLVFVKKDRDPRLHTDLVQHLVQRLMALLKDPSLSDSVNAILTSYKNQETGQSYLLATTSTPSSEYNLTKLKCLLFLQSSALYDAEMLWNDITSSSHSNAFVLENVIISGRLGNHDNALSLLVRDIKDGSSAELYCSHVGEVISMNVLDSLHLTEADIAELTPWLAYFHSRKRRKEKMPVQDATQQVALIRKLLRVYLNDETRSPERVSGLLRSQAPNLEPTEVLTVVPMNWPLESMAPFIKRHLRHMAHDNREAEIVKALSTGQNLEASELAWERTREAGYVVEEPDSDGASLDPNDEQVELNEKGGIEIVSEAVPILGSKEQVATPIDGHRTLDQY